MKSGQVGWSIVNLRGQDAGQGWGEQGCEVQAAHLVQASDCCSLLECDNRDWYYMSFSSFFLFMLFCLKFHSGRYYNCESPFTWKFFVYCLFIWALLFPFFSFYLHFLPPQIQMCTKGQILEMSFEYFSSWSLWLSILQVDSILIVFYHFWPTLSICPFLSFHSFSSFFFPSSFGI